VGLIGKGKICKEGYKDYCDRGQRVLKRRNLRKKEGVAEEEKEWDNKSKDLH